jgi:hypothetical protein
VQLGEAVAALLAGWAPPARAQSPGAVTGARLWLRADAGVTATSGQVSQWADQSGSGQITTQAARTASAAVTLVPSTLNFNPVVQFTGASGQSMLGTASTAFTGASTIIVVARINASSNQFLGVYSARTSASGNVGGQGFLAQLIPPRQLVMDGSGAGSPNSANTSDPVVEWI